MPACPVSLSRRRLSTLAVLVAVMLMIGQVALTSHDTHAQSATPAEASPVASPVASPAGTTDAELQLAEKFAPILNIKTQDIECSTDGEQYLPVAVDVVLGDPQVRLMQRVTENGKTVSREVMTAPTAADLFGLDDSYYLDFPGNSRLPGCDYEEWSRARYQELGTEPSVYARVATESDRPGEIVVQYWLYWVYNDFNNTHESDWEMIQLHFEADSAQEVLDQNLEPVQISFAQHGGGEQADWDDDKVQRDGNHVNIFSASGSHASYYDAAVWVGWGSGGSGFGCDRINPELDTLSTPTRIILIPNDTSSITADSPLAWLTFGGRWGQHQSWEFNGPFGPNAGTKWDTPISWTDNIRQFSLAVPHNETIGPGPSGLFCNLTSLGGTAATLFPMSPWITIAVTAVALGGILWFAFWARHQIARAIRQYFRHPGHYLPISAWLIVVAAIANWINIAWRNLWGEQAPSNADIATGLTSFGIGTFQQFMLTLFVAPIIMLLTERFVNGEQGSLLSIWREALPKWWVLLRINLLNALILILISLTIIGIPLAIYKNVQWFWSSQSAILNDARVLQARHQSRRLSKHHWWSTLRMAILVAVTSGIPGPIIGMVFFVTSIVSIETAGLISGLIYAVCYPIAVIASTLYYLELRAEKQAEGSLEVDPARSWFWRRNRSGAPPTTPETDTPGAPLPAN